MNILINFDILAIECFRHSKKFNLGSISAYIQDQNDYFGEFPMRFQHPELLLLVYTSPKWLSGWFLSTWNSFFACIEAPSDTFWWFLNIFWCQNDILCLYISKKKHFDEFLSIFLMPNWRFMLIYNQKVAFWWIFDHLIISDQKGHGQTHTQTDGQPEKPRSVFP